MDILNSDKWFADKVRFNPEYFICEGVEFKLISLSDDLIEDAKNETTEAGLLNLAAEFGVSSGGVRVLDDDKLAVWADKFWSKTEALACEPSVKFQVGLRVCEMSGLDEHLQTVRDLDVVAAEEEEAEVQARLDAEASGSLGIVENDEGKVISGDDLTEDDLSVSMDRLSDGSSAYPAASNL